MVNQLEVHHMPQIDAAGTDNGSTLEDADAQEGQPNHVTLNIKRAKVKVMGVIMEMVVLHPVVTVLVADAVATVDITVAVAVWAAVRAAAKEVKAANRVMAVVHHNVDVAVVVDTSVVIIVVVADVVVPDALGRSNLDRMVRVMDKEVQGAEGALREIDIGNVYRDKLPVNASHRVNNRTPR